MRTSVEASLATKIDPGVVSDLLDSYLALLVKNRAGDYPEALMHAGRFVEHVIRAVEYLRTGTAPASVKSVAPAMRTIEADTTLAEPLRLLIPRAAYGMIYNVRSKRNAVHVNEIDPSAIDATLAVSAAGWILAEFLRLFHTPSDREVARTIAALTRVQLPLIEVIGDDVLVSRKVPASIEILLLIAHSMPSGLRRLELGRQAKCSPSTVTRTLQALEADRLIHKRGDDRFCLTGPGEASLLEWLETQH